MSPLHAIEGLLIGAFTVFIAATDKTTSLGWQIVFFAIGIGLGAACVVIADWHLRRQTRDRSVQQPEAGGDA